MGFFGYFGKGVAMAMLKGGAAEDVAADDSAFVPALFIMLFPALVLGVLGIAMTGKLAAAVGEPLGTLMVRFGLLLPVLMVLLALVGSIIGIGILHLIAKLFGGSARFLDYFQTMGVGSLVVWGSAIPFLGVLFLLWSIPVYVVVTSRVHSLSTGKAVLVVLMPYLLIMLLAVVMVSFGVVGGLMGAGPGMGAM